MPYGPIEEVQTQLNLTDEDGSIDIELLVICLLELRERIKELEDDRNDSSL